MKKIASFQMDHTKLLPGVYLSRTDGDVLTYDIRLKRPNREPVLENGALHTIEHLFATYVRSGDLQDGVIYFGPMGCRTGFYFLVRGISPADVLRLTREAFAFIAGYEGEIPGASEAECGNWREHDLPGAREEARRFCEILRGLRPEEMHYLP